MNITEKEKRLFWPSVSLMLPFLFLIICGLLGSCRQAEAVEIGDREVVLKTLAMESASYPEGMEYVALTLINRAEGRGTTMSQEALRKKQYSCWNDPKWAKNWLARHYTAQTHKNAVAGLESGLKRASRGELKGLRHYHTVESMPYWAEGKRPSFVLGCHNWYEDIK